MPSIYEPVLEALSQTEDEIEEAWTRAPRGDWRDSLQIVGSLVIATDVPPRFLRLVDSPKALMEELGRQRLEDIEPVAFAK